MIHRLKGAETTLKDDTSRHPYSLMLQPEVITKKIS